MAGLIYGGIQWKRMRDEKEERLLLLEYIRQNRAFGMNNKAEYSGYHGYEEVDEEWMYVALAAYEDWNCKYSVEQVKLTLEDIKEYLSSEYNEDGSLRVYSRSENIQAYIMWYLSGGEENIERYWNELEKIAKVYSKASRQMNIEQLQELINKYNDPYYEINAEIMGEVE